MQCISPISIPHPHGTSKAQRQIVPCGRCYACLTNRRNDWSVRLYYESKQHFKQVFLTLTYDDEHLEITNGNVEIKHLQDFFKRIRKKAKIRYYAVGEYGTRTFRAHYHILLFGLSSKDYTFIQSCWPFGFISIGEVSPSSIHYVTKYHVNRGHYPNGCMPPFALMSSKPGIGNAYIEKRGSFHHYNIDRAYYTHPNGIKQKLPRYFRDKLYTYNERQLIAKSFEEKYEKKSHQDFINDHAGKESASKQFLEKSNKLNTF